MYNYLLVNVDELWLKGKNRPIYFKQMRDHVTKFIKSNHPHDFRSENQHQRLIVNSEEPFADEIVTGLANLPGIFSIIPCRRVEKDLDVIAKTALEELQSHGVNKMTFKVESKRVDKSFPLNSQEISVEVGHRILKTNEELELSVDVRNPEVRVDIKLLHTGAYVSSKKIEAVGGLPVGMSGHLITMISGGFDSPVASYMMSKRGCKQSFIFFYSYPYVGEEVKDKILDLFKALARFQNECKLYIVPFGDIQTKISKLCKPDYRTILFRKYMVETANLLANKLGADALLTGDALGQVSSQTIGNIALMDQASRRPIFRPLLGSNKREIIATSRQIGTHDISVIPHDDACALFAAKHPVTKPHLKYWEKFTNEVNLEPDLISALDNAEVYHASLNGELQNLC